MAGTSHAMVVRYKELFFGTEVKAAYEDLFGKLPDTVGASRQLDSIIAGSVCKAKSPHRMTVCYTKGGAYGNMSEQKCCLVRTHGEIVRKLTDSLMQMRGLYEGFKSVKATGRITESINIRENTYTAVVFFDAKSRFWKYEVSGNRYSGDRLKAVFSEADSLKRFMEAKYSRPTWTARKEKLTLSPNGEVYYANWEFQEYVMYLVISSVNGMYSAKEVVMDRALAKEYEQGMRKQGKKAQTLSATPK